MVKEIIFYIEGDTKKKGKGNAITLRQGFREFFQSLSDEVKTSFDFKLLGSRELAIRIFLSELEYFPQSFSVLLVDSEGEVDEKDAAKTFLQKISAKFDFKNVKDEQCHLMIQLMESWFLADKEKLAEFYGKGFRPQSLPKNKNVEAIAKADVETGLKNATRDTSKGEYDKGSHAGEILRIIDSDKVCKSASHCNKLFEDIRKETK